MNTAAATLAGLVSGDDLSVTSTGLFDSKNVGTGKTVTLSSSYDGDDVGNYAISSQAETMADISAKALTVSGITAADKVYDGNTTATVNTAAANLAGLVSGDNLTVNANGLFDSKHVGTGKTVTLSSEYSGADVGNYSITNQASTTADIAQKALAVSGLTAADKVYDGNTTATVSTAGALLDGLVAGDAFDVAATGTFDSKNVGTGKTVTLNSEYSGADVGNYSITNQAGTAADITRLASVIWVGGPTGNWFDADNWQGGAVPDLANVAAVEIPANVDVTFAASDAPVSIDSLGSAGSLTMTGGELNVGVGGAALAGLTQSGGVFDSTGDVNLGSFEQIDGATRTSSDFNVTDRFSQTDGGTLTVGGNANIGATVGDVLLSNISVAGSLDVLGVGGDIVQAQGSAIRVEGDVNLSTDGDIALTNAGNEFGAAVSLSGQDVALNDGSGDLLLGNISASGKLILNANGGVTQEPETNINAGGSAYISSLTSIVELSESGNTFVGGLTIVDVTTSNILPPQLPQIVTPLPNLDTQTEPLAPLSSGGAEDSSAPIGGGLDVGGSGGTGGSSGGGSNGLAGVDASPLQTGSAGIAVSLVSEPTTNANGMISVAVPKSLTASGAGFSFVLPEQIAEQSKGNAVVQVTTVVGEALPSWLSFVRENLSFVAVNVPSGGLPIQVLVNIGNASWVVVISERNDS